MKGIKDAPNGAGGEERVSKDCSLLSLENLCPLQEENEKREEQKKVNLKREVLLLKILISVESTTFIGVTFISKKKLAL